MNLGRLNKLGISSDNISDLRSRWGLAGCSIFGSPKGTYGGPCDTIQQAKETIHFLVDLGLKEEQLFITKRWRILENDSIMPDAIITPYHGEEDRSPENCVGFRTFSKAFAEAKQRYTQKVKWLMSDKGKPLQPISILIVDDEGNQLLKTNNQYHVKTKR